MNVSGQDGFSLRIEIDKTCCFCFCSHFYKAFKDRARIKNASILKHYSSREVLRFCADCQNKIKKYLCNYDALSNEFFFEGRKLLIQYYPEVFCDENSLVIYISASE